MIINATINKMVSLELINRLAILPEIPSFILFIFIYSLSLIKLGENNLNVSLLYCDFCSVK